MRKIIPTLLVVSTLLIALSDLPSRLARREPTFCGKTVAGWVAVLHDKTCPASERSTAIWALGCLGPKAKAASPALVEEARNGRFPNEAVVALVGMGEAPEVTVPSLVGQFVKEGSLRWTGAGSIGYSDAVENQLVKVGGPAVPDLLRLLEGPDQGMRIGAAVVLGRIGPSARAAIPTLLGDVEHPENSREGKILRRYAIEALGRIGPDAKAAEAALIALLGKPDIFDDYFSDYDIAIALDGIGVPPGRELLGILLNNDDMSFVPLVAWLGPRAREMAPSLRNSLNDKKLQVRLSAAVKLSCVDPSAVEAIPVLMEGLNPSTDPDLDDRYVPESLARFGPRAKAAMPRLVELARDKVNRTEVLRPLVQIDPEGGQCIPALIAAVQADDTEYEAHEFVAVAADCLGLLGPRAKDAVPALAKAMTRDFPDELFFEHNPQVSAARALGRIGPGAKSAIPSLIAALKYRRKDGESKDSSAAAAAARVLGSFGADAKSAVPALIEAARTREKDDDYGRLREAAILALGQIGPDASAAIPTLQGMMIEDGKDSHLQPELIEALYRLAPDGKEWAENWLRKPLGRGNLRPLERRAIVLAAMGRTTPESDWAARLRLKQLDQYLEACRDPRDGDGSEYLEERLETLARFGVAGKIAIPRLNQLRTSPNPWVRMWAAETLGKILPASP